MKLLIDCSNLRDGGGCQVASSFIHDILERNDDIRYIIVLSPQMKFYFNRALFDTNKFEFIDFPESSYASFYKRIKTIKRIEKTVLPSAIFSTFGPSYYKSKVPKLVGFAKAQYLYKSPYFDTLSLIQKIKLFFFKRIQLFFFEYCSDALVFETDLAKNTFKKKYNTTLPLYTVSNALNQIFKEKPKYKAKVNNVFKILVLSRYYPHKNLDIIPRVIDYLIQTKAIQKFKFVISLEKLELKFDDAYDTYIDYIGKVEIQQLPKVYSQVNMLFMPSLLETFSASYLEAMYNEIPIVASHLKFATDICGKGATYFNPTSAKDAADKIKFIMENPHFKKEKIKFATENFRRFHSSKERTKTYLSILKNLIN